jgi:hypothetical protein
MKYSVSTFHAPDAPEYTMWPVAPTERKNTTLA